MLFVGVLEAWHAVAGSNLVLPLSLDLFVQPLLGVGTVVLIIAAVRRSGLRAAEYLGLVRPRVRDVLRGIGWGVLAWIALVMIMLAFNGMKAPAHPNPLPTFEELTGVGRLPFLLSLWLSLLVAAPVAEEILFRGFLYRGLVGPLGTASTIVLTSIVFGVLHKYGFGWDKVVAITLFGFLLGWLRYRHGATTVPIVAHATLNFIQSSILTIGVLVMP
jgi:membrane protease YdiL (CAAX protease family)